jgi:diguanylate cyclase (GGDEF)-like protein
MLLISLDNLKQVREQAGHACSEEVVREVAHLMKARAPESVYLARLGEDEFGILLQSHTDEMAEHIAGEISNGVTGFRHAWRGKTYRVGVHIGVVNLSEIPPEECLAAAYSALHEAEIRGPGSVVVRRHGGPETTLCGNAGPEAGGRS